MPTGVTKSICGDKIANLVNDFVCGSNCCGRNNPITWVLWDPILPAVTVSEPDPDGERGVAKKMDLRVVMRARKSDFNIIWYKF